MPKITDNELQGFKTFIHKYGFEAVLYAFREVCFKEAIELPHKADALDAIQAAVIRWQDSQLDK